MGVTFWAGMPEFLHAPAIVLALTLAVVALFVFLLLQTWRRRAALARLRQEAEERSRIERARARLAEVLEASTDYVSTADTGGHILYYNRGARAMVGLGPHEDISQRRIADSHPASSTDLIMNQGMPAAARHGSWVGETVFRRRDGSEIVTSQLILAHKSPSGEIEYYSTIARDISESKRAQRELQRLNRALMVLSTGSQAVVQANDECALLKEICRIAVQVGGHRFAWIGQVEHDTQRSVRPVAWAGFEDGYLSTAQLTWADVPRGRGPTGTAIRTGRIQLARDFLNDPLCAPWAEQAGKRGYRSTLVLPLLDNGLAFGVLNLYAPERDAFDEEEIRLFSELAATLAFGIVALRGHQARDGAQEALRQSQQRLALHVQQTPLGVIEWDLGFRVTQWNPAAEKIFGHSRAQAMGRHASFIVPAPARPQVDQVWSELLKAKGGSRRSNDNLTCDGRLIHCEWYHTPLIDADGSVVAIASLVQDVTAQKQLEDRLRKASLYSRTLIEASLDPLVTISKEGKIMDVNRATELVTGTDGPGLIGSDFCNYFTEPEKARHGYQRVFAEGFVHDYPLAIRHTSGRVTEVLYNATIFKNPAGAIEGVFAAARDITARKQAERKLADQQFYTRSLIEASIDAMMTTDAAGVITDVNHQMEELTGLSRTQLIGTQFGQYCTDPQCAEAGIQQVLREGQVIDYELAVRHRHGRTTMVAYNATTYLNSAGKLAGVFAAARDITERKRAELQLRCAEQELRSYAGELERSNRELQDFASIASHDLQEPLRKIMAFGERLRAYAASLDESGLDCLTRMQGAADRMSTLIEDLLRYSRVTTRAQAIEKVDLTTVACQVMADLDARLRETRGRVLVNSLPVVQADSSQMRQLLQNLLANALKFHPKDTPPEVTVTSSPLGNGMVAITVSDNGVGFDEKYLDRIFRPFQRLHSRADFEGSGMGLAICQKIVQRHGGEITARSQPGSGSSFTVSLPLWAAKETKVCENSPCPSASSLPKTMTMTTT
jgi:PAS domain S-box-containing protein